MKIIFLINTVVSLIIFIFVFIKFIKHSKIEGLKRPLNIFISISLLYLIFSALSFYWFLYSSKYLPEDFSIIYSLIITFQTLFLFNLVYLFRKNKRIFYFLFVYLSIFSSNLIHVPISQILLICSFLITLILFVLLISVLKFEEISKLGIVYSLFGLIIHIILLFNKNIYFLGSLFLNILFCIFIIFTLIRMEKFPHYYFYHPRINKKRYYLLDFLRYFLFIIILTNFVFVGTITVHEVGHLLTSQAFDCGFGKIIYEQGFPHTEILCNEAFNAYSKVILGGIFLPLLIASLLYFAGGTFIKEMALLIVGFNLMLSYKDIIDLGFSKNFSIFFTILGIILILISVGLLAKSRTTEEQFIHMG